MTVVRTQSWRRRITVLAVLLSACLSARATADEKAWPTNGWRASTPEAQGMRSNLLSDMLERIRWNEYRIHSVSVVRNGRLVLDAYFHPWRKGRRHAVYSVTKSVMSILIGIAIDKGFIAGVHTPVLDFFPNRVIANLDARKRALTLEHLLTMTTGLNCRDSYRYGWAGYMKMRNSADWTQFVLDLPMVSAPGERFEYCNGASFLLSAILAIATKSDTFAFAKKHLFVPLGIKDVSWSASARKISNGCCGLSLTPHDMAKFGWLLLKNGNWNGRQLVSSAWVQRSTRRHVDAQLLDHYGYQWWRDRSGYYMAVGYKGQWIFILPKKNIVVVFTGNLAFGAIFAPKTLVDKFIIPAAKSNVPLPANVRRQNRLAGLVATSSKAHRADHNRKRKHVWRTPADGLAHDGIFVRRNSPTFRFRYPQGSRRDETLEPTEIMRMRTATGVRFNVSIMDIPGGVALADAGPVAYATRLRKIGSNVEIASNQKIALGDGTIVYRTYFRWLRRGVAFRTVIISAFRDGKWVLVKTHHRFTTRVAEGILKSLEFQVAK